MGKRCVPSNTGPSLSSVDQGLPVGSLLKAGPLHHAATGQLLTLDPRSEQCRGKICSDKDLSPAAAMRPAWAWRRVGDICLVHMASSKADLAHDYATGTGSCFACCQEDLLTPSEYYLNCPPHGGAALSTHGAAQRYCQGAVVTGSMIYSGNSPLPFQHPGRLELSSRLYLPLLSQSLHHLLLIQSIFGQPFRLCPSFFTPTIPGPRPHPLVLFSLLSSKAGAHLLC